MTRHQQSPLPSLYDMLEDAIPNDHARQSSAPEEMRARVAAGFRPDRVLDLGCGDGRGIDLFRALLPGAAWTGVDIEISPEVLTRGRTDGTFVTFDGVNLPFGDGAFDLVYSYQVFEHVRHPEALLAETRRVLAPEGLLIGQTSQLEPYHSFSYWNYTVFGFRRLLETAGFRLLALRPGIDGPTLIERAILGRPKDWSKWFSQESPRNQEIDAGPARHRSCRTRNFRKLMFCGQFIFVASPSDAPPPA